MSRSVLLCVTCIGLLFAATYLGQRSTVMPLHAAQARPGIAVVELFTSEGCSSCPPADTVLRELATAAAQQQAPVFALSFHVDYWNRLGWRDPYSSPAATERQKQYARRLELSNIYTPQLIVNGVTEMVGSRTDAVRTAVTAALRQPLQQTLDLQSRTQGRQLLISWQLEGPAVDELHFALVQRQAQQRVTAGENTGETLSHLNVVRAFVTSNTPDRTGEVSLDLPKDFTPSDYQVIAYCQAKTTGAISGATAHDLSPPGQ